MREKPVPMIQVRVTTAHCLEKGRDVEVGEIVEQPDNANTRSKIARGYFERVEEKEHPEAGRKEGDDPAHREREKETSGSTRGGR